MPSGANAAIQVLCNWEGRSLVAITVEGNAADLRYYHYYDNGYYEIEATRSGIWMLLDEPRPVLSIQLIGPDKPIGLVLRSDFAGGRCWR